MKNTNKIICKHCGVEFQPKIKRSFLGFQLTKCSNCNTKITLPLTKGYRLIYWLLLLVCMPLGAITILTRGDIPIPGLLGIATIVALLKDRKLKQSFQTNFS